MRLKCPNNGFTAKSFTVWLQIRRCEIVIGITLIIIFPAVVSVIIMIEYPTASVF